MIHLGELISAFKQEGVPSSILCPRKVTIKVAPFTQTWPQYRECQGSCIAQLKLGPGKNIAPNHLLVNERLLF